MPTLQLQHESDDDCPPNETVALTNCSESTSPRPGPSHAQDPFFGHATSTPIASPTPEVNLSFSSDYSLGYDARSLESSFERGCREAEAAAQGLLDEGDPEVQTP